MRQYKKVDKIILETLKTDLLQAFNALDSKQRPERYKIDFAMFRINSCISCIDKYLNNERSEQC